MRERVLDLLMDNENLAEPDRHLLVPDPEIDQQMYASTIWSSTCGKCKTTFRIFMYTHGSPDIGHGYADGLTAEVYSFCRIWMPCNGKPWALGISLTGISLTGISLTGSNDIFIVTKAYQSPSLLLTHTGAFKKEDLIGNDL